MAPWSTQPLILPLLIKWIPGSPVGLAVTSLCTCIGSAVLQQMNSTQKKESKCLKAFADTLVECVTYLHF